ncbi:suppressor of fused domain protein [Virgisporangium ochraceum]|uniref:suppressor of fused domain protein n=1 Tax=Virgisporangium ochraceum TaxID=65505 RepID=UPI0019413E30|nr:suppressor of fused domain protein [Virgisporangium ochraceum]
MDHDLTPAAQAMLEHLHDRFPGQEIAVLPPAPGRIPELVPGLHILSLTLSEGGHLYATAGLWDATQKDGHGLETVLHAPVADDVVHVETLTMVAYYHATGGDYTLDHGHTVPIGRPWVRGSSCDHLLLSLPYPWGPGLETCTVPGGHIRVLWLLPITAAEKRFRHTHDLETLEQRFEAAGIVPTDPHRRSVVP